MHNEWTIVRKNVETSEIIQVAKGFNVVLDRFLNKFSNAESLAINKVAIGSGSGTPNAADTGLFNPLAYYTVSEEIVENSKQYLKVLYTAIIPSSDLVGSTLTELGLTGVSTSNVFTHAMIEDSEGNQISIGPKTDVEEITIYSLFIFEVSQAAYVEFPRFENSSLQRTALFGLKSQSAMTTPRIYVGSSKAIRSAEDLEANYRMTLANIGYLASTTSTPSAGVYVVDAKRFGSTDCNGEIRELVFTGNAPTQMCVCRIIIEKLPSEIFNGIQKTDDAVGTGNGSATGFNLPWSNPQNAVIKVDGVTKTEVTDYTLTEFPKNKVVTAHDFFQTEVTGTMVTGKELIFDTTEGTSPYAQMLAGENWILDLKESKKYGFGSIGMRMTSTSYRWTSFDVDVSADGTNWTKVATAKAASATTWIDVAFDTVPKTAYRYIKMTANTVVGTGGARFTEVRFTATDDQIKFVTAPANNLPITASYKLGYIPKDSTKLLDLGLTLALTR